MVFPQDPASRLPATRLLATRFAQEQVTNEPASWGVRAVRCRLAEGPQPHDWEALRGRVVQRIWVSGSVAFRQVTETSAGSGFGKFRYGHRSLCSEISAHVLCGRRARRVSRLGRDRIDADRHLPRDQYSGRHRRLAVHRSQHAGDGAAGHHLQPVRDHLQRQRHPGHRGADAQRHLGPEDLLPARRQPRSGDLADRRRRPTSSAC